MQRPATWKVLVLGIAIAGLGLLGAGTASAASSADCQSIGPNVTRCETNGSAQIATSPRTQQAPVHPYGPFFWQNPAVGSAAR